METQYLNKIEPQSEFACPLRYFQDIFGSKWKVPIVCMLASGVPLRNATIKRRLGNITNAMLAQTLKELEASGIVHRKQFNEVPPHVEYTLTERGKTVIQVLSDLGTWAIEDMKSNSLTPACGKCSTTC